jgi:hypothetical protein
MVWVVAIESAANEFCLVVQVGFCHSVYTIARRDSLCQPGTLFYHGGLYTAKKIAKKNFADWILNR